jgi:hypothetical protein
LHSAAACRSCVCEDDPGARLRDIAANLGIAERSARGIVTDLTAAGYVTKLQVGPSTVTCSAGAYWSVVMDVIMHSFTVGRYRGAESVHAPGPFGRKSFSRTNPVSRPLPAGRMIARIG